MTPALTALFLILGQDPSPQELRAEATKLYRAKKYAEACPKFEQAAKAVQNDGALWADLGVCLQKLGKTEEAAEANHQAVASGDARTRMNAYFNLVLMGKVARLPEPGQCSSVRASTYECRAPLSACGYRWERGPASGTGVRIGISEEDAKVTPGVFTESPPDEGRFEDEDSAAPSAPYVRGQNAADALTSEVVLEPCASCKPAAGCTCTNKVLETKCQLVLADGCTGRIALYCSTTERGAKKPRAFADEMVVVSPY